jgi:hypothetical protein
MLLELELLHLLLLLCPLSLVLQLIYLLPSSQDDGTSLLIRDIQAGHEDAGTGRLPGFVAVGGVGDQERMAGLLLLLLLLGLSGSFDILSIRLHNALQGTDD